MKFKIVIFGFGSMGQNHYNCIKNNFGLKEIVGLVDSKFNKKKTSGISLFKSINDLLKSNLDFNTAIIACPTKLHYSMTKKLIKLNKNVFVEKPLSSNLIQAEELYRLSKKKNVKLFTGHIERYNPVITELKKRIKKLSKKNKVTQISVNRVGISPSRDMYSNVSTDLMIHDIDVINYLLDKFPINSTINEKKIISKHRSDISSIILDYGDTTAHCYASWVTPTKERIMKVYCNDRIFRVDYIKQELQEIRNKVTKNSTTQSTKYIKLNWEEPLYHEHKFFRNFIMNRLKHDPYHAVNVIKILEKSKNI